MTLATLLPALAEAQTARRSRRAAATATRQARSDALAPPENPEDGAGIAPTAPDNPAAPPPPPFTFDLLVPLLRNSDPQQAQRGTPSIESTPEARLGWTRLVPGTPLRLSALLDASVDRFARAHDADADVLYGRLRAQYESGADDQEWQPFVNYLGTRTFGPGFSRRTETWHDFALGIVKTYGFDARLKRVPRAADTDSASTWQFGINAAVQPRLQEPGPASIALLANPSVTWSISPAWNASFEVDMTWRRYNRANDTRRRDLLVTPVLTVEFTPPGGWLPHWLPSGLVLDLQVFLARQYSSVPEGRFNQTGAGPILRSGWRF